MPEYDFRCTECDEVFEVSRPMGSSAKECCPSCGAAAKRVFTPVGVAFKGSGFHNTDYRPKPSGDESGASGCPAKESGSSTCASCPVAE